MFRYWLVVSDWSVDGSADFSVQTYSAFMKDEQQV